MYIIILALTESHQEAETFAFHSLSHGIEWKYDGKLQPKMFLFFFSFYRKLLFYFKIEKQPLHFENIF